MCVCNHEVSIPTVLVVACSNCLLTFVCMVVNAGNPSNQIHNAEKKAKHHRHL